MLEQMLMVSLPNASNQSSKLRRKCYSCGESGQQMRDCSHRTQSSRGGRPVRWRSFHHTDKHDDSECRNQLSNGNNKNNNDRHQRQAKTAITDPASTMKPLSNYGRQISTPSASTVTGTCLPSNSMGFTFVSDSHVTDNHCTPDKIPLKMA